jgi:hypothetical protein
MCCEVKYGSLRTLHKKLGFLYLNAIYSKHVGNSHFEGRLHPGAGTTARMLFGLQSQKICGSAAAAPEIE